MFDFSFPKGISLIYGAPATGKTTLCMQLVSKCEGKIVYIDTENTFNPDRVKKMNPSLNWDNIMLFKATRYSEQYAVVKKLSSVKNISMVIIDSFTHYYRKKLHEKVVINPPTIRMLKMLQDLEVPVVLTSQVYDDLKGDVKPIASDLFRRFSSYDIKLINDNSRCLLVDKVEMPFMIDEKGLLF